MAYNQMSKDRVHFTIRERYLTRRAYIDCVEETLGFTPRDCGKDLHIVCRPSQFARFVILRHVKYGEANSMADLDMKLVKPPEAERVIDVSKNPDTSSGAP